MKKFTFLLVTLFTMSLLGQVKLTSADHQYKEDGVWKNVHKQIFIYDSNSNLSSEVFQRWDYTDLRWENMEFISYTYNENNKLSEELFKFWDSNLEPSVYVNNIKTIYTYNSNNKVTGYTEYFWMNNGWVASSKLSLSYNSEGKLSQGLFYNWNGTIWGVVERTTVTYGENGRILNALDESWDGAKWNNSGMSAYEYNSENKIIVELKKIWNNSEFVADRKHEYEYDANGNQITDKVYFVENGAFTYTFGTTYTFDTTMQMSSFSHPFADKTGLVYLFDEFPYVNKLLSSSSGPDNRITYNYGEATANLKGFKTLDFAIYPNPTSSIIKIDDSNFVLRNVEVYNLLGKRILTSTKNELNLQQLVNGVYLIKIVDENRNFVTKTIVKN